MTPDSGRSAAARAEPSGAAERRLADERLRLVIESLGGVIFDYDLVRRSVFLSEGVTSLFGWEEFELTEEWWSAQSPGSCCDSCWERRHGASVVREDDSRRAHARPSRSLRCSQTRHSSSGANARDWCRHTPRPKLPP